MLYSFLKFFLFKLDAEKAHELIIHSMKWIGEKIPECSIDERLKVGDWPSPIGLAAGLDKNAEAINFLSKLPFGAIEVGTVTPRPQEGNEKPRLFRIPEFYSLRNKMGFNNFGAQVVLENIHRSNKNGKILGVNLGKNKVTANEDAYRDYVELYRTFVNVADYLVINVSSPNTPGLRDLLQDEGLKKIFEALQEERKKTIIPLYVKISPDMSEDEMRSVVRLVGRFGLTGIVATNTTIDHPWGDGGASGAHLKVRAAWIRQKLLRIMREESITCDVIGVGGIDCYQDIVDFWKEGGKRVQIYTSFIYHGPNLINEIHQEMIRDIEAKKLKNVEELISFYSI